MSSSSSRNTVTGTDPRFHQLGFACDYVDSGGTAPGVITIRSLGGHVLTGAGAAALLNQVNTYLAGGKAASILAAGAPYVICDLGPDRIAYSCLAADAAAQTTALQALVVAANVKQILFPVGT